MNSTQRAVRRIDPTFSLVLASAFLTWGASLPAQAQKFELTPFYGYQLGGELEDRYDDGFQNPDQIDFEEGETTGLILGFGLTDVAWQVELFYSTQDTEMVVPRFRGRDIIDIGIDYYQIGLLYQFSTSRIRPFLVGSLGATSFDLPLEQETRFSWTFGGGLKIMANDHFGFRLEGRFNSTLVDSNDEIFCNPAYCFAYPDGTFLFQFDFKGGLIFAF